MKRHACLSGQWHPTSQRAFKQGRWGPLVSKVRGCSAQSLRSCATETRPGGVAGKRIQVASSRPSSPRPSGTLGLSETAQGLTGPPSPPLRRRLHSWAQLRLTGRVPGGRGDLAPHRAPLRLQPEVLRTFSVRTETSAFLFLLPNSSPEVGELGVPLDQERPPCLMQARGAARE